MGKFVSRRGAGLAGLGDEKTTDWVPNSDFDFDGDFDFDVGEQECAALTTVDFRKPMDTASGICEDAPVVLGGAMVTGDETRIARRRKG